MSIYKMDTVKQLSLEAFESNLRGHRCTWFITEKAKGFPPGFNDMIITENPPFQRKILIRTKQTEEIWKYIHDWDTILTVTTNQDWSLALTLILYQTTPSLVVIAPELNMPPQVYQKINGNKATLVQFAYLKQSVERTLLTADSILFQQIATDTDIESVHTITTILGQPHTKQNLRDIFRDTRSAGASILLSSIDEPQARQCMYWYYAVLPQKSKHLEPILNILEIILQRNSL